MRGLARRPDWQEQLRRTTAANSLRARRPDQFPLQEVQELTNLLLRSSSSTLLRRGIPARSEECDTILVGELQLLRDDFPTREAGVVACLHAFTYDQARGQLLHLKPDPDTADRFFDHRVAVYLQCLILARAARPEICSAAEADAATEFFTVVRSRRIASSNNFPSVWRVLGVVGRDMCDDVLSVKLVKKVLCRRYFQANLRSKLAVLKQSRRWLGALKLVDGLHDVVALPRAAELLQDIFPEYPMWATWQPNRDRLVLWEGKILSPFRHKLGHVFDLEGPDTTNQQRGTLRRSGPGGFNMLQLHTPDETLNILDRLLDNLDAAIKVGREAVNTLVHLCIDSDALNGRSLYHVEAVLELNSDSAARKLAILHRVLTTDSTVNDRMLGISDALPLLSKSTKLQTIFATNMALARRAPTALSAAQKQFCKMLQENRPAERFAHNVRALGSALLESSWLHEHWKPAYINMLRQIPSETEVRSTFRSLRESTGGESQAHMDFLAIRLGSSQRRGQVTATAVAIVTEDPVWEERMDLDRDNLRRTLRGIPNIDMLVATACVKQSHYEADTFVRELTSIIINDTDQVCINLAAFLGPRMVSGPRQVNEAWKSLLMHMMRQRPRGLLERCGEQLLVQSWRNWVENLRRLYGERHLDPEGRLGFTRERFTQWTAHKLGVGRTLSDATVSTGRTNVSDLT